MILESLLALAAGVAGPAPTPLRFAWPERCSAIVELETERNVGGGSRSLGLRTRLDVAPDGPSGGRLLRFSAPVVVSVDGRPFRSSAAADPTSLDVARVMGALTPTFAVDGDGRFVEVREADRFVTDVLRAAGLPAFPLGMGAFSELVTDVAPDDWNAWVEFWSGISLRPGEWERFERQMTLVRRALPAEAPGRSRFRVEVEYPSESVRRMTEGALLDLAVRAGVLGDDPGVNRAWIDAADFGPITETITVEIETATMRPITVDRQRSFSAENDGFRVEGTERRTHRFRWLPDPR